MKTILEDISPVKKKLVIEIEAKEVEKKIDKVCRDFGKRAKIKGFRPGKIPRRVVENYFGKQILEETTNSLVKETLPNAVEETKIIPLNIPVVENEVLKLGENYKYSAVMEVRPEFEVKDYLGIKLEKEKFSVTEEDVDAQLKEIREANAKLNPIDEERGIKEGDYVIIDYEGFDTKGPIKGVKETSFSLIVGKNRFYPGIENALIGLKKGDIADIKVDFDDSYFHSGLAGKNVNFKIEIVDLKEVELPELNNEFIANLGDDIDGLDNLKEKVREGLILREEKRIDKGLKEDLLKKVSDSVDFELPECLVDSEVDIATNNVKQNLMRSGTDFEKSGLDEAKLRDEFRPASEKKVKDSLILVKIAKQNNLEINEQEMDEGFEELSKNMGQDPQLLRKYYEANNIIETFRQTLLREKTLNYLVENAKVTEIDAESES